MKIAGNGERETDNDSWLLLRSFKKHWKIAHVQKTFITLTIFH